MRVIVYGAGGHGKVVTDILLSDGHTIAGFVDDGAAVGTKVLASTIVGGFDWLRANAGAFDAVAMGIGDNRIRAKVMQRVQESGVKVVSAVHQRATISSSATIGEGAVVMAGAVVNPDAVIEAGAIINTGATIDHDCRIGKFVHIAPQVGIAGTVTVGEFSYVGIGACVRNNLTIGARTMIGAGAAVVCDIGDDVMAVGVPARIKPKAART